MNSAIYSNVGLMLKLVDSHDLKSCGFSRPSSSLGEATTLGQRVSKTTKKSKTVCLRQRLRYDKLYMINKMKRY